jgi:DNA-binding NarL/FixJ family response regulator
MKGKRDGAAPPRRRILLVDDHAIMRRGIRDLISGEQDLEVCAEAADAEAGLRLADSARPDLAILDLSLGRTSGLDLIRGIRARRPEIRILVLSMHDDELYAERALRAGALGYVNKTEPGEVLLHAIRKALRGEMVLSPPLLDRLVRHAVHGQPAPRTGMASLTDRELQVFELAGRGLGVREIADRLFVSVKTVESHIERLKAKLEVETSRELVRRAVLWVDRGGGGSGE